MCDKLFKVDCLADEVMTVAKDVDYDLQESAGSNSNSKKKNKAGRPKLIRESEQLDSIRRYGFAKLYQTPLGKAQQKMN